MIKRILAFSVLLFLSLSFVNVNNAALEFAVYIKPNCTYTQVSENSSHSVTTYVCTESCLTELQNKGITNPTIKDNLDAHTTVMKSGSINGSGNFPVIIKTDNVFFKRSKNKVTDKILVYAHCAPRSFPSIDSITATAKLSLEAKAMVRETLEGSFAQLSLPEKRIEIGDTFTRKNLIKIALGSGNMEVELVTTYKLVAITSGIAYFTTTEAYGCKMDMSNARSSFSGKGGGKFSYNIGSNYYASYQTSDTLYMHVKYDATLSTNVVSVNGYSVTTTITKE